MSPEACPPWLCGVWSRSWIRRASADGGGLGPPSTAVEVRYVQTPIYFADVRRPTEGGEGTLAFGGVTTVQLDEVKPPLVTWHACLDIDAVFKDAEDRWADADSGRPRPSEDQGYFSKLDDATDAYTEVDPAGTLEERWERIDDGAGRFLAARRGSSIVVLAGSHFAYAHDERAAGGSATYVAGRVGLDGWIVELAAAGEQPEGSRLVLPGGAPEWSVLPGSTIDLSASGVAFVVDAAQG